MNEPQTARIACAAGLSAHVHPIEAVEQAVEGAQRTLGDREVTFALVFASGDHADEIPKLTPMVRSMLGAGCVLGVSAESVLAGPRELERTAGVSVFAASMPGADVRPFTLPDLPSARADAEESQLRELASAAGFTPETRGVLLFADPFSVPVLQLLPALDAARDLVVPAREFVPRPPIIGGMASAGTSPRENRLALNADAYADGLVGLTIRGRTRIDAFVSQGCRPFGPTMVITKARKNLIQQLGGKPAVQAIQEAIEHVPPEQRKQLKRGLFVGRVINEYKDRFGRADFLIRNIVGADEQTGAVAVSDLVRVGLTIQMHMRDAATADEDLRLLLDAQQLHGQPAGALLVSCNGRGTKLFDRPHHDASVVSRAFAPGTDGARRAKPGSEIDTDRPGLALGGFFAAGEIGPVGDRTFLHAHSAAVALFREG